MLGEGGGVFDCGIEVVGFVCSVIGIGYYFIIFKGLWCVRVGVNVRIGGFVGELFVFV